MEEKVSGHAMNNFTISGQFILRIPPHHRIFTRNTYISAVINNVFSSPDRATLEQNSGNFIRPNGNPSLLKIHTPPGPVAKTFPYLSIFNPSGAPFAVSLVAS